MTRESYIRRRRALPKRSGTRHMLTYYYIAEGFMEPRRGLTHWRAGYAGCC